MIEAEEQEDGTSKKSARGRQITIVVDNESWILPFAEKLVQTENAKGNKAVLARAQDEVATGFAAFYLGCIHITPDNILHRNRFNLVVHESDLPKGRGFAPMFWQVLEGNTDITICLIEAVAEVDAGPIFLRKKIKLKGTELNHELRDLQGNATIELCTEFLSLDEIPSPLTQSGAPSYYKRRTPADSELDIDQTIRNQFNLLRIVENEDYPAFFEHLGRRYKLQIEDVGPSLDKKEN